MRARFQHERDYELGEAANQSLGIGIVQLVVESEERAADRARQLIKQARQEAADNLSSQEIIELIETIVVYKFPRLSRQEVEEMLGLSELKRTKVYQEALEEGRAEGELRGKLLAVPLLLKAGMTTEQIAEQLGIDMEAVRQIAQPQSQTPKPTEDE